MSIATRLYCPNMIIPRQIRVRAMSLRIVISVVSVTSVSTFVTNGLVMSNCLVCGNSMDKRRYDAKTCSDRCRARLSRSNAIAVLSASDVLIARLKQVIAQHPGVDVAKHVDSVLSKIEAGMLK